jgi:hypothetical protein
MLSRHISDDPREAVTTTIQRPIWFNRKAMFFIEKDLNLRTIVKPSMTSKYSALIRYGQLLVTFVSPRLSRREGSVGGGVCGIKPSKSTINVKVLIAAMAAGVLDSHFTMGCFTR